MGGSKLLREEVALNVAKGRDEGSLTVEVSTSSRHIETPVVSVAVAIDGLDVVLELVVIAHVKTQHGQVVLLGISLVVELLRNDTAIEAELLSIAIKHAINFSTIETSTLKVLRLNVDNFYVVTDAVDLSGRLVDKGNGPEAMFEGSSRDDCRNE